MLHRGLKLCAGLALCIGTGAVADSSIQLPAEPIKWSIKAASPENPLKPGARFFLELTARIEEGWHLYALEQAEGGPVPTRIAIPAGQPFGISGAIESGEPISTMDPNFGLMTQYYEEQAIFNVPVKVEANAPGGTPEVRVDVTFQSCTKDLCLPPKTVKLGAHVDIVR